MTFSFRKISTPGSFVELKGHESQHCNFKWLPSYSPQFTQKSQSICTTYHLIGPLICTWSAYFIIYFYKRTQIDETDFLTQLKIGNYVSGFISTVKYRLKKKKKTVSFTSLLVRLENLAKQKKTSPLWQIW